MIPTTCSPSITTSAPILFSAISLSASNTVALGAMEYTFGSAFDLRMWATDFIADSPYPADSEELSTLRKESPASAGPGSRWSGGLLRQAGTDSRCSTDVSGGAG